MASNWFYGRPQHQTGLFLRHAYSTYGYSPAYRSSINVIKALIGANVAVFGGWYLGEQTRNAQLLRRLTDSFTLSLRNIKEHRYYVLITSAFSHRNIPHIVFNMFNLWTFGSILSIFGIGGLNTAALCLASGVAGSVAWAYHHAFIKPDPRQNHNFGAQVIRARDLDTALGASGMVMGAGAAAACLAPFAPMNIMFIPIAIPLWGIVAGYFAIDAFYLNTGQMFGHAAHMGGAVAGVAYYMLALRRFGGIWGMLGRRLR